MTLMTHLWSLTYHNQEIPITEFDTREAFRASGVVIRRSHLQRELHWLATSTGFPGDTAKTIEGVKVTKVNATVGAVYAADGRSTSGNAVRDLLFATCSWQAYLYHGPSCVHFTVVNQAST